MFVKPGFSDRMDILYDRRRGGIARERVVNVGAKYNKLNTVSAESIESQKLFDSAIEINNQELELAKLSENIKFLEQEISQIDLELSKCERSKKGWKAATVIGSVGVVGTGTGIVVQSVQLKKANKDSDGKRDDVSVKDEVEDK